MGNVLGEKSVEAVLRFRVENVIVRICIKGLEFLGERRVRVNYLLIGRRVLLERG